MKRNHIHGSAKVAVCFLVLVHLATSVIHFECPKTISKYCSCQTDPEFLISCSKNNETFSINNKLRPGFTNLEFRLEINCTNNSNEEIYKLLNFEIPNNFNESNIGLKIDACPTSVVTLIEHSVLDKINFQKIEINANNNLVTLPMNILRDQTNLTSFTVTGCNLTSLPENVFMNKTKMIGLEIDGTSLTSLPENIFIEQINLLSISITRNKMETLPEKIFNSQINLGFLFLNGNRHTILPNNISYSQTDLN